jgi:hypothetical protein
LSTFRKSNFEGSNFSNVNILGNSVLSNRFSLTIDYKTRDVILDFKMPVKKKESESSLEEFDDGKNEDNFARKDAFITFTNEREFKNIELIRSRIC